MMREKWPVFCFRESNNLALLSLVVILVVKVDVGMGQTTGNPATTTTTTPPPPRLKIAVPVKRGFKEFVNVTNNGKDFSGFAIEVFMAVVDKSLSASFKYDFIAFAKPDGTMNGTYNDMLQAVHDKKYDAAVGDINIRFNRRQWVNFTTPYSDIGVGMLVRLPVSSKMPASSSLLPLLKGLMIAALPVFLITALIFCILDCVKKKESDSDRGQARNETQLMHRETMRAIRDTRVVMVLWFAVLVLVTTCYVASLTSLLKGEKQPFSGKNLNQLFRSRSNIGFSRTSFVREYLSDKGFPDDKLIPFDNEDDIEDLLSKGTENGGVDAVIHGTRNLQLFMDKRSCDNEYALSRSFELHIGGLGFAFQIGSQWTDLVSEGILKLIDNGELAKIQNRYFGKGCPDKNRSNILVDKATPFIIIAGIICFAFVLAILYAVYFTKTFKYRTS